MKPARPRCWGRSSTSSRQRYRRMRHTHKTWRPEHVPQIRPPMPMWPCRLRCRNKRDSACVTKHRPAHSSPLPYAAPTARRATPTTRIFSCRTAASGFRVSSWPRKATSPRIYCYWPRPAGRTRSSAVSVMASTEKRRKMRRVALPTSLPNTCCRCCMLFRSTRAPTTSTHGL